MGKQGEVDYLEKIGEAARKHAADKPFSDPGCGHYLVQLGALMVLLPPPPAKLLDFGCGTGWTSRFFARRGYDVTGQDIAPSMIDLAIRGQAEEGRANVRFVVGDYEKMVFDEEFDVAVFFDSLHHSEDEKAALASAYRALRPGGVCITAEPGRGHARDLASLRAKDEFDVTERDMPPASIIASAKAAGFRKFKIYPRSRNISTLLYESQRKNRVQRFLARLKLFAYLIWVYRVNGFVVMAK